MIIDQLPNLANPNDTDEIPIERGTTTYKATRSAITNSRVSKTGDTMTGALTMKSSTKEDGVAPSSEQSEPRINFQDKNGTVIGWLCNTFTTTGNEGIVIQSRRVINGANQNAYLALYLKSDGSENIVLSSSTAWRKSLNLGTDGVLPLLISQGGSGQTGTTSTTVISDIITENTNNFTVTGAKFYKWGKVAQIEISAKCTTAIDGSSSGAKLGQIVTGKRPATTVGGVCFISGVKYGNVGVDGNVNVYANFSVNLTVNIRFCYLLPS